MARTWSRAYGLRREIADSTREGLIGCQNEGIPIVRIVQTHQLNLIGGCLVILEQPPITFNSHLIALQVLLSGSAAVLFGIACRTVQTG